MYSRSVVGLKEIQLRQVCNALSSLVCSSAIRYGGFRMPALSMKETPRADSTPTEQKLGERIRGRAYQLYEAGGRKDGHDLEDWFQGEIDITGNAAA